MADPKKLLITRRRAEFFVMRKRFGFDEYCGACRAESRFLSLEDAIAAADLTMREIVRLTETGEVHFLESADGFLVVCQTSLAARAQTIELIEITETKILEEKTL